MGRNDFLYLQVYNDLKDRIAAGVYQEGDRLPSDQELKEEFGVSIITIRKALDILKEEDTIQRIPGVGTFVKEHSQPNGGEQCANKDKQFKTIGIVLEHISSSYGLDLLYRIDQKAEEMGYKTITRFSYYDRDKEDEEIDFLISEGIDGLIVMPCHGAYYNLKLLKLIIEEFPIVIIDKKLDGIPVPSVRTDNKQAIKDLVGHLKSQGCAKIAFVSPQIVGTSSLQERRDGFYEAASEHNMEALPECTLDFDEEIFSHPPREDNIHRVAEYLLKHRGRLDGIVCAEFSLMPPILEAARRASLELGRDVKICCVDGPMGLPYTHMKQNEIAMADKAVDLLLAQINKTCMETEIMVPAILVEG